MTCFLGRSEYSVIPYIYVTLRSIRNQSFFTIQLSTFSTSNTLSAALPIEQEQEVTSFARVSMARRSIFFELVPLSLEISVHDSFVAC